MSYKKKRERIKLYKKKDNDEDVLKKLKEVRQNLQDSLDDKSPGTGPKPVRKRGERRLYKKEDITTAPIKAIAPADAKKVKGVVITSSPGLTPDANRDKISASLPEEQPTAYFALEYSANDTSHSLRYFPPIKYCVSIISSIKGIISDFNPAYCLFKSNKPTFMNYLDFLLLVSLVRLRF